MTTVQMGMENTTRDLPKGWRWARLDTEGVATVIMGQSPAGDTYVDVPAGLPFFQGKADFGDLYPTPRKWCTAPSKIAEAGDILISVRAPVGPTNVAKETCCIGRGLAAIRPDRSLDSMYLLYFLRFIEPELAELGAGSTFEAITRDQVSRLQVLLPPLDKQRAIARQLECDMAEVTRLRTVAERQREAVEALPAAYLRQAFDSVESQHWPWKRLGDVCVLLPSKSIATEGDTEVLAITTACLTESGFQASGVKKAHMWASDASESLVRRGEILVARSNTAELVGRVAVFAGEPAGVVASDLTMRIWPGQSVFSSFLAAYLSFLYQSGYWREIAGGASDSMKKITRTQIMRQLIPVPSLHEQYAAVRQFEDAKLEIARLRGMAKRQQAAIDALPGALLHEVFGGFERN